VEVRLDIFQSNEDVLVVIKNLFEGDFQELAVGQCDVLHAYIIFSFC
jgi:hypothetical protein